MSAYADKIAMEVLEADERAGSRGVAHPPLEWHKAVALAHAVSKASPPEASGPAVAAICELDGCALLSEHYRNGVLEAVAGMCDEYADETEQRANEERGYWTEEAQAVFRAQKELAAAVRALKRQSAPEESK